MKVRAITHPTQIVKSRYCGGIPLAGEFSLDENLKSWYLKIKTSVIVQWDRKAVRKLGGKVAFSCLLLR